MQLTGELAADQCPVRVVHRMAGRGEGVDRPREVGGSDEHIEISGPSRLGRVEERGRDREALDDDPRDRARVEQGREVLEVGEHPRGVGPGLEVGAREHPHRRRVGDVEGTEARVHLRRHAVLEGEAGEPVQVGVLDQRGQSGIIGEASPDDGAESGSVVHARSCSAPWDPRREGHHANSGGAELAILPSDPARRSASPARSR